MHFLRAMLSNIKKIKSVHNKYKNKQLLMRKFINYLTLKVNITIQ